MSVDNTIRHYEHYLRHQRGKADNTIRADVLRVRRLLRYAKTTEPTEDDVYRFLDVLYAEGRSMNTIRNYVYAIRESRTKGVELDLKPPKQMIYADNIL